MEEIRGTGPFCGDLGVDVVWRIQVAGDQELGVVEVGQKSSPGPDGDPRSPRAKQSWVRWGGRSRAVDLNEHTKEETKSWIGMETEKGLFVICNGRKVRWDDLEEMQEGRVVEVKAEMRGGMGNRKKMRKGKNQSVEEPESGRGPMLPDCYSSSVDRMIEENEMYKVFLEQLSKRSDVEVEQAMHRFVAAARGFSGQEPNPVEMLESGIRRAVEARRKGRCVEQEQITGQEKGKKVSFGEEESSEETRVESTDEPEVMGRLAEVRTGRGSSGLVRGEEERCWTNESCGKGKEKGHEGKGEHGNEGGRGGKGVRQKTPSKEDEEDERTVVAPDMGAGGSHPQATTGPKEEEEQRRAREAREEEEQRRACEAREEEERRGAQETEKQEWEGKAVQDGYLAAMEDRRRGRHLEKSQGEVDEAEVGAGWAEVWVSGVCFGCGEEVFSAVSARMGLQGLG